MAMICAFLCALVGSSELAAQDDQPGLSDLTAERERLKGLYIEAARNGDTAEKRRILELLKELPMREALERERIEDENRESEPVPLSESTLKGIQDGLDLSIAMGELTWDGDHPGEPQNYWPPRAVEVEIDGESQTMDLYLSRRIDPEDELTDDQDKAEKAILHDPATGHFSNEFNLVRPVDLDTPEMATESTGPEHEEGNPESDEQPGLAMGGNLSRDAVSAIRTGFGLSMRDDMDWRRASNPPSESNHFMPPYRMTLYDPATSEERDVLVYFSKKPVPSFSSPPTSPEEADEVTLYDPDAGEEFRWVPIALPSGVKLASD